MHPIPHALRRGAGIAALLAGAALPAIAAHLDYIGQATLPTGSLFAGTQVGGLSGIDYDPLTHSYVAISDDRSQLNPARYYRLTLDIGQFARSNAAGSAAIGFSATAISEGAPQPAAMTSTEAIAMCQDAAVSTVSRPAVPPACMPRHPSAGDAT